MELKSSARKLLDFSPKSVQTIKQTKKYARPFDVAPLRQGSEIRTSYPLLNPS